VDILSLTKADCAKPVLYYDSLLVTLLTFKGVLAAVGLGMWMMPRIKHARKTRNWASVIRPQPAVGHAPAAARRVSVATAIAVVRSANWPRVFRTCFMVLFFAYPSVSFKVFRLFKCRQVEGVWWLVADMRLQCYTSQWYGYAFYASVMALLYVFGFPAAILAILCLRRKTLFGEGSDATRRVYGFLYEAYGPNAWWWEVEELLRKLLLSAVVVLMDNGSPLQTTVAVLISGWAHVLHAVFKPWGVGSRTYLVQHGALFVTSFVFLMGLLFKVDGVATGASAGALSAIMLLLCIVFAAWWVTEMGLGVRATLLQKRQLKRDALLKPVQGVSCSPAPVAVVAAVAAGATSDASLPPKSPRQMLDGSNGGGGDHVVAFFNPLYHVTARIQPSPQLSRGVVQPSPQLARGGTALDGGSVDSGVAGRSSGDAIDAPAPFLFSATGQ
jgi:hypothetical protein